MLFSVLAKAIALFFCYLLLQAAWHKLASDNRGYYQHLLSEYDWLPTGLQARFTIVLLAAVEALIAIALLLPFTQYAAAFLCTALMLSYGFVLATQWFQGKRNMDCGCAGPAAGLKISPALLWRNALLALAAVLPAYQVPLAASELILALAMAIVFSFAYSSWEGLLANAQRIDAMRSR